MNIKKVKRRIVDHIHKNTDESKILELANLLGVVVEKSELRTIRLYQEDLPEHKGILSIITHIENLGYSVAIDMQPNSVTFWIMTDCPLKQIRKIPGVSDVV